MAGLEPEQETRWSNDPAEAVAGSVARRALNSAKGMQRGFATRASAA